TPGAPAFLAARGAVEWGEARAGACMGMHHGYLVADLPWPTLFALLQQRTGHFVDRGPIDSIDAVPPQSTDEGWWLAAGEYAGRAYVLDYSWQLSGAD